MESAPQAQQEEAITNIPSLDKLYDLARFLPIINFEFSLTEKAEDFEETPESLTSILDCFSLLGHLTYIQDGDKITITHREFGKLTAANYIRTFAQQDTDC